MVGNRSLLGLDLCNTALDVGAAPFPRVHTWNEKRRMCKEMVHLLERALGSFWQEAPEEDRVGQVAYLRVLLVGRCY